MTTTNPNPLDHIRALAPADMTDDELGVAVWDASGRKVSFSADTRNPGWGLLTLHTPDGGDFPADGNYSIPPREPFANGGCIDMEWLPDSPDYADNPAIDLNALMRIVRVWAFADAGPYPERIVSVLNNLEQIGRDDRMPHVSPAYRSDYFPQYRGLWLMLLAEPRQLAEAFVTAAREVADA